MKGITDTAALWYASRATGVVALVLLSVAVLLGIWVGRHGRLPGLPRFAPLSLHRSVTLLAVSFVAVHVVTAVADPYVSISVAATVVPFVSRYESFWLGLGAVATDLMLALIVTSLLRARIGRRAWRGVHWLAYLCWPVAVAHSVGSGTDLRRGWLLDLTAGCVLAVGAGLAWRARRRLAPPAERAALVLAAAERAGSERAARVVTAPAVTAPRETADERAAGEPAGAR
jgi:sulfoxide reductase heme-binding subunit YedZ